MSQYVSDLNEIVGWSYEEAHEDYIGLWQVIDRAATKFADAATADKAVFDSIRALLARGLLAGNLTRQNTFVPWDQQQPDAVIARIQREWQELGHTPTIDDIAWFHLPR